MAGISVQTQAQLLQEFYSRQMRAALQNDQRVSQDLLYTLLMQNQPLGKP